MDLPAGSPTKPCCAAGHASCKVTLRRASPSCGKDWPRGVQQDRNFTFRTVSPEQRKRIWLPEKSRMDEDGLRLIGEATEQSGDRWFVPELHRLKGELLLEAGRRDEVEACLNQALKAAREQGARLLELRTAMSLSRVLQAQGRRSEAQDLLASICTWFTEGLDTADLQEAKALLDQAD